MPQPENSGPPVATVQWPATGVDQFGKITTGPPCSLDVRRWEWVRREKTAPDGTVTTTDADLSVNSRVKVGSVVWQGRLSDLPPGTSFGTDFGEIYRVVSCDVTPDVRNRIVQYAASVARLADSLPPRT